MTDEQTVERVAKAIAITRGSVWPSDTYTMQRMLYRDMARAAISAMQPALAEAKAQGWNEALREAATELEVNWGHKATPEMRDAILALIDAETVPQPDLPRTSEPAPAPEVTVQQAAQVMLDGAKSGRSMDSEKSGRAMHAACDAYEITDHLSIPRIVDAVVGAWLRSLAQEGKT